MHISPAARTLPADFSPDHSLFNSGEEAFSAIWMDYTDRLGDNCLILVRRYPDLPKVQAISLIGFEEIL